MRESADKASKAKAASQKDKTPPGGSRKSKGASPEATKRDDKGKATTVPAKAATSGNNKKITNQVMAAKPSPSGGKTATKVKAGKVDNKATQPVKKDKSTPKSPQGNQDDKSKPGKKAGGARQPIRQPAVASGDLKKGSAKGSAGRPGSVAGSEKKRSESKAKDGKSVEKRRAHSVPLSPQPPGITVESQHRQPTALALKLFEQAVKTFNQRKFAEAKALFEALQSRHPHESEILARVHIYLQVCNQKTAQADSLPKNADQLYDRGVYALNLGKLTEARKFFEEALRIKPNEAHVLYSLAATCVQSGNIDQALDFLQRSIRLQSRFRAQSISDPDFAELRDNRQFLAVVGIASPFDRLDPKK